MQRLRTLISCFVLSLAACAATPQRKASETEIIASASNEVIAEEYQRRTRELLIRPPPKFPTRDQEAAYIAELQDPNSELGKYARRFFADHLIFAEAGDVNSMAMVAQAYWEGWFGTVTIDPCRALDFAFKAARKNQKLALDVITRAYLTGVGLPKDERRVIFWSLEIMHLGLPWPVYAAQLMGETALVPGKIEAYRKEWEQWNPLLDLEKERAKICADKISKVPK